MSKASCNVLHIITGLNDGGAEAVLHRLCSHDSANTHVVISLMGAGKYGPLLRESGIDVYCLDMPQGKITFSGLIYLWKTIRALRPDVVQTWMYHADLIGGVVARLAGVSNVVWGLHNCNLAPGTVKRSTIWVARICATLSRFVPRRIVSCSQQAALSHQSLGYAVDKFIIIPNGYNLSQFFPDDASRRNLRSEWSISEDTPLLGMVARFDPQKDHANLIAALGRLARSGKEFRCVLVGAGMESTNTDLVAWLVAQGIADRTHLLGRRSDIPAVMSALDIHVLSSLGEAFPNVLAEAMACGTPCVTTDVGDAALIVGTTGWAVPAGDSAALAQGISSALEARQDAVTWITRQRDARERIVEKFSLATMVDAYKVAWRQAKEKT